MPESYRFRDFDGMPTLELRKLKLTLALELGNFGEDLCDFVMGVWQVPLHKEH